MVRLPITLTTDFGTRDAYVAQMKGVILGIVPDATIVDVTHELPQGDVRQGTWIVEQIAATFPARSLHVIVVDPGVGSDRRLVALEALGQRFLSPDNGLLSEVLRNEGPVRAWQLEHDRHWRKPVSHTFHGRDILAPTAAHWLLSDDAGAFGPEIDPATLVRIPESVPVRSPRGVRGEIVAIDRFGNLTTNIRAAELYAVDWSETRVNLGPATIRGVDGFYAAKPPGTLLALVGSSGRLEIAVSQGDAAAMLGATVGMEVAVEFREK
jgi:S-adenosylmethionine hydrolase